MCKLVDAAHGAQKAPMSAPEIFDRRLRRLRRDRAARAGKPDFLRAYVAEDLLDRLGSVQRTFTTALDLGAADGAISTILRARGITVVSADAGALYAARTGGVQCEEDALPFADGSFDLVLAAGGLDLVNDLPGALTLIRRMLRPDGLFLGAMLGAGSLPRLRAAMLAADEAERGGAAPRIHPQIDVRSAGDLLARAGFALPVADGERLDVRYANPWRLIEDLRAMAATNMLRDRAPPLGRRGLAALFETLAQGADPDGRVTESFEIVTMIGWAPAPSQPQPARRGSAVRSLADALKPPPKSGTL